MMNSSSRKVIIGSSWILISIIQLIKSYLILKNGIISVEPILLLSLSELVVFSFTLFYKYKSNFIFRFLFIFSFLFYCYNHFYPLFYFFIADISIFKWFKDIDIYNSLELSTLTFSLLAQIAIIESNSLFFKEHINRFINRNTDKLKQVQIFPIQRKVFFVLFSFFSFLAFYYIFKYVSIPAEIKTNRMEVLKILWTGPGIYIKIALIGVSAFVFTYLMNTLIAKKRKDFIHGLVFSLPILLFWIVHIMAGNRREFVSFLIFILIYYVFQKRISFKKLILSALSFFVIMTLMSKARGGAEQSETSLYLNSFGEFIMPYNTLIETMRNDMSLEDYRLGATYLYPVYALVPRSLWPEKPLTTASQFSKNMKAGFGLGFSPLTEAYINWGRFSIIILPLLILLIYRLFMILDYSFPFILIFLLMNSLNLNRGELGTVALEIFIMYFSFYLLYRYSIPYSLKNAHISNSNLQGQ